MSIENGLVVFTENGQLQALSVSARDIEYLKTKVANLKKELDEDKVEHEKLKIRIEKKKLLLKITTAFKGCLHR